MTPQMDISVKNGRKLVRQIFTAEEHMEGKRVAHEVAAHALSVALVGVMGKPAYLYFAQTHAGSSDMGAILKQTVARFGGKGGGARDFAQGGGIEQEKLGEALAFAESLL